MKKSNIQLRSLSAQLLVEEALSRGISVLHLNTYSSIYPCLELCYGTHVVYILGSTIGASPQRGHVFSKDKMLSKIFFRRAGISTIEGNVFERGHESKLCAYARSVGYPLVIKPLEGTQGKSVYVDIKNKEGLVAAASECFKKYRQILVEKMFEGTEYRLFATRTKFLAAVRRDPANVVGDGTHTIEELIKEKNKDPRRSASHSGALLTIKVDAVVQKHLQSKKLTLKSVPLKGRVVYLRTNSNLSTGGDSIDVTDMIHPSIRTIAVDTIKSIPGLYYGGVDFITSKDISKRPSKRSYAIIEVNSSPMLSMHHLPYKGKKRDIAGEIIDLVFPETKGKKSRKKKGK